MAAVVAAANVVELLPADAAGRRDLPATLGDKGLGRASSALLPRWRRRLLRLRQRHAPRARDGRLQYADEMLLNIASAAMSCAQVRIIDGSRQQSWLSLYKRCVLLLTAM